MNRVMDAFSAIEQQGAIARKNLVGCTVEEISIVEKHFGGRLPKAYKDFLSVAGKSAGKLFQGSDIFYPRVLKLQAEANELLLELALPELLPNDAKVFCMHQGYELNYFRPVSDDPPVFQFVEGRGEVAIGWKSFSEFIDASIRSHLLQSQNLN
jgi:SMI1-KNR4 cell-wall